MVYLTKDTYEKMREKKIVRLSLASLSPKDKQLLEAVHLSSTEGSPTLGRIIAKYQDISGKNIPLRDVYASLSYAESIGLAKRDIVDMQGQPFEVWHQLSV